MHALLISLHTLAAVIWVGGMFFAYVCLRPAAGQALEPPNRLKTWALTLQRFFFWVWISIAALLLSGYAMIFVSFGGFAAAGIHIHIMQLIGIAMMLIFAHVFFAPYRRLRSHVNAEQWPEAARQLDQIRVFVKLNMILGLITVIVGAGGRFLGF